MQQTDSGRNKVRGDSLLRIVALCCENYHVMLMDRNEAIAGAKEIAAYLDGPLGRRKLQAAVDVHLDYFEGARSTGATWRQIADLLTTAGVYDPGGKPVPVNVLRALVSRAARVQRGETRRRKPALEAGAQISQTADTLPPQKAPVRLHVQASSPNPAHLDTVRERIERTSRLRGLAEKD